MALTVQTNLASMAVLRHLGGNNDMMTRALERLSSGFRINSAADDAAGYAISSKLDAEKGRLNAASQNAAQATAMVKMADAAVNEIQSMVARVQVLATQAASGNNSQDLAKLESERVKLEAQIDKIAHGSNYNGIDLLGGAGGTSGASTTIQVGSANSANDQVALDLTNAYDTSTNGLSLSGSTAVFTSQTASQTYITTATTALSTLTSQRADLGATVNQLSHVSRALSSSIEQLSASVSTIRDANMAQEMSNFTKNQVLVQTGTAMLAQANRTTQSVLALFR